LSQVPQPEIRRIELDAALIQVFQARYDPDQGSFSTAIWPNQANSLAAI
jgi:hypothetical protein